MTTGSVAALAGRTPAATGLAGEDCCRDVRVTVHAACYCVHQGAVELVGAAFSRDIAAEACSGPGKDVIVGLVECKSDEPGPETDSLDCSRCRNGIRLAQIDEDDIGLCVSDLPDAMRVQVDDVDHYDVSTAAQGRAKPSPTR